jgi:hypothetical protein
LKGKIQEEDAKNVGPSAKSGRKLQKCKIQTFSERQKMDEEWEQVLMPEYSHLACFVSSLFWFCR